MATLPSTTLNAKDIIGQAQSGTGKTATFTIGILQTIDEEIKEVQAILMTPTRELASQIENVIKSIAIHTNITSTVFVGGSKVRDNMDLLRHNTPHIIVGTPIAY